MCQDLGWVFCALRGRSRGRVELQQEGDAVSQEARQIPEGV
jgi:hypothetical protein